MNFTQARYISRMTKREIADYLQLSPRTISRYEESGNAPKAVIECLLMIGGHCPKFSRRNDFTDWRFAGGFLYSPEGDKFTQGDVRAGKMALLEMNRQYRLEDRRRKEEKAKHNTARIYHFPSELNAKTVGGSSDD